MRRVAVICGGGGAKAAAHLGAARALREVGIEPVHWIGTSMGAVIALALAEGQEPADALRRFAAFQPADLLVRDTLQILKGIRGRAILKGQPFRAALEQMVTSRDFAALSTPCTVTAVAMATGRETAFGTGGMMAPVLDALAASCALPPYLPSITIDGQEYFDGGIRAAVPLRFAEGLAVDAVIAIDTGPGFDEVGESLLPPPPLVAGSDAALGWAMAGTTQLLRERWATIPDAPPLLWLRPVTDRGATFAMSRIPAYAEAGYQVMLQALETSA